MAKKSILKSKGGWIGVAFYIFQAFVATAIVCGSFTSCDLSVSNVVTPLFNFPLGNFLENSSVIIGIANAALYFTAGHLLGKIIFKSKK